MVDIAPAFERAMEELGRQLRGYANDAEWPAFLLALRRAADALTDAHPSSAIQAVVAAVNQFTNSELGEMVQDIRHVANSTTEATESARMSLEALKVMAYTASAVSTVNVPLTIWSMYSRHREAQHQKLFADLQLRRANTEFVERHTGNPGHTQAEAIIAHCIFWRDRAWATKFRRDPLVEIKAVPVGINSLLFAPMREVFTRDPATSGLMLSPTKFAFSTLQEGMNAVERFVIDRSNQEQKTKKTYFVFVLMSDRDPQLSPPQIHSVCVPTLVFESGFYLVGLGGNGETHAHAINMSSTVKDSQGNTALLHNTLLPDDLFEISYYGRAFEQNGGWLWWTLGGTGAGASVKWATLKFALPKTLGAVGLVGPAALFGGGSFFLGKVTWNQYQINRKYRVIKPEQLYRR